MRLIAALGLRDPDRRRGPLRPVLREFDSETGRILREFRLEARYVASADENQAFTSGWVVGDTLIQPTRTELLWIDLHSFTPIRSISHPLFSDLHSVAPTQRGTWLITATGHDSVLEVDDDGHIVCHHWLRTGSFEDTFQQIRDFRTVPFADLKPHAAHANHAIDIGGEVWVTRMVQRTCETLDGRKRIDFPEGPPHDGRYDGARLWFTTIHGCVVSVDPDNPANRDVFDVATRSGIAGGWWRGIAKVGTTLFVGRSALREPRWREWALEIAGRPAGDPRCLIAEFDLRERRFVRSLDAGDHDGGQIYAIYPRGSLA